VAQTIIVIGAGMVGAACALKLQSTGFEVALVDPGPPERAASFGNAGHIAVEQVEPLSSWSTIRSAPSMLFAFGGPLDFRLADAPYWGPWAMQFMAASGRRRFEGGATALGELMASGVGAWTALLADIGRPDLIRTDGHVVLWFDEREAEAGRRAWDRTRTGPATFGPLCDADLAAYRAMMPGRPPVAGILFEGTARLSSPQAVRAALFAAFEQRGGEVVQEDVTSLSADGAVHLGASTRKADRVVVCAGVRSRALMEGLGVTTPLVAERGYSIQIPAPDWPAALRTAVVEGLSIVLAPHDEGLRVTSYVEFAAPDSPPDPRKWDRLEQRVRALGLDVPPGAQRWIGCRPTLPDYLPAIGSLDGGRILYAFGHQHLGVTLSAVTAELILGLVEGQSTDRRFDIRRFRH
jgi:glycine/D-amino acid oxidase-like deaminating enzyme